jgi:TonB family protein
MARVLVTLGDSPRLQSGAAWWTARPELAAGENLNARLNSIAGSIRGTHRLVLWFWVSMDGTADHVEVRRGSGDAVVDSLVLSAFRTVRFVAARVEQEPFFTYVELPVTVHGRRN